MPRLSASILVLSALLCVSCAHASDWAQWFGSNHNGVTDEKLTAWGASPKVLWRVPMGNGLGTMVVVGGKAYCLAETQGGSGAGKGKGSDKGGVESVVCLDANTGKQVWASPVGPTILHEGSGHDGPRSTPAVVNGKVYVVGTYLNVACFDAASGKPVWGHDCAAEFGGEVNLKAQGIGAWGCANSAVVDDGLVFVHGGGPGMAFLAFDAKTGAVVWKNGSEIITHSSPTVGTILDQRQVIFFHRKGLVSLDTKSGKELWKFFFPYNVSTAISPVICGDIVYCSAGYKVGGGACKITKEGAGFKATEAWRVPGDNGPDNVASHWSTPVFHDGYLYGLIGFKEFGKEPLKCVDINTGKIVWSHPGFGQGGTAIAGDNIVILSDTGDIVMVEASPKEYKELTRFKAFQVDDPGKGKIKCWNQPVISGGRIYARSTTECLCLDVGGK